MTLATPLLLAGLMAGFVRVDLEPPAGHSLAGYFGPRPCEGVLDPVEASCVALSDGSRSTLLYSLDLVEVKRLSPARATFFTCLTNGSFGYLPTDDAYDEGAYETDSSIFAPGASRRLIQALQEMMANRRGNEIVGKCA